MFRGGGTTRGGDALEKELTRVTGTPFWTHPRPLHFQARGAGMSPRETTVSRNNRPLLWTRLTIARRGTTTTTDPPRSLVSGKLTSLEQMLHGLQGASWSNSRCNELALNNGSPWLQPVAYVDLCLVHIVCWPWMESFYIFCITKFSPFRNPMS